MNAKMRLIAFARHRARDAELLPLVEGIFCVLKTDEQLDLIPPTKRQVGIALRFIRRFLAVRGSFVRALARSLTQEQRDRLRKCYVSHKTSWQGF